MQIKFHSIQIRDIKFLQNEESLYAIDFRATGEELSRDIDAMFKYENGGQWFDGFSSSTAKRHIIVNETVSNLNTSLFEAHIAPRNIQNSHVSVFSRLEVVPNSIKSLWTAIPHPDADEFANKNGLALNTTYESFLKTNDKLTQKKLLGDFTPNWTQYSTLKELLDAASQSKNSYLKKRIGAGGFSVFKLDSMDTQKVTKILDHANPSDWFIEEEALGEPQSIQGLIDTDGNVTVFGFTKQSIVDETIYMGAELIDVTKMSMSLQSQISLVIQSLKPVLKNYIGFFGIDFMADNEDIKILECNVRMTAATIPALLRNKLGAKTSATYTEDKVNKDLQPGDIVIAVDQIREESDTLSFDHLKEVAVGYSSFIQLSQAKSLVPQMDDVEMEKLKKIIKDNVSDVLSSQYHNFWPYGWTVTMILAESHCVLSSWHIEQNILIDIFCCKYFDHTLLADALSRHFDARTSVDDLVARYLQ